LQPLGTLSRRELATWHGRAAIYALPARYEPFGLSVLEAALCGCALVLGDIDSMRELWDGAALFARPGDTAGLRATLARLIEDRQERERLAERARERALGLDLTRTGRAYLTLYEGLLQRADQGRGPAQPMGLLDLR
jgi:glycosyltransferase involved in cell wall biosynthesis